MPIAVQSKTAKIERLSACARAARGRNPRDLPTMAAQSIAPTITANGTTNPLTTTVLKSINSSPTTFQLAGTPVLASGVVKLKQARGTPTGGLDSAGGAQNAGRISVVADCTKFVWRVIPSAHAYRFLVDGQYVDKTGTLTVASSGTTLEFIQLDFTSVGGKKPRTVSIEVSQADQGVATAYADAAGRLYAPAGSADSLLLVNVHDSFGVGNAQMSNYNEAYPLIMADLLGVDTVFSDSVGGTRWAGDVGSSYAIGTRILNGDLVLGGRSPDIIVLNGSVNDAGQSTAAITANVAAATAYARQQNPQALIFAFGVYDVTGVGNTAQHTASENAFFAGIDASGVTSGIVKIPITTDANGAWLNSGNRADVIGADNIHMTDAGNLTAARWQTTAVLNALGSLAA